MKQATTRYIGIGVLLLVVVLLFPYLSRCGNSYQDNPLTNPVHSKNILASIDYVLKHPDRQNPSEGHIQLKPEEQEQLLSLFDGSQVDPRALRWQEAGTIDLIDEHGEKLTIRLYSTTPELPDAYKIDDVYYRKTGLLVALNAWVAEHQPIEDPHDAPETTHR